MAVAPETSNADANCERRVAQTKLLDTVLRHRLHGEFLALLGAVEKIKIEQLLVRKAGLIRQSFEIVQNVRTQVDSHGSARREEKRREEKRREERFLSA